MSDPFVQQLAGLSRAHMTRAKWVFVPSHAVGRTLGERIALEGTNWLNAPGVVHAGQRQDRLGGGAHTDIHKPRPL